MYLCVCNAVTDHMVREAIRGGCASFTEVVSETGLTQGCGQCVAKTQTICDRLFHEIEVEELSKSDL